MKKIKSGDEVIVIAGNDKGKRGKVMRLVDKGQRIFVEGIKMVKKHVKPNPRKEQPGGIIEKEASIHVSNVAIFNSQARKADRVGFKEIDGKKRRVFKSTGELVDL